MSKMDSKNISLKDLTKIPEKEFKQHFRNWMEQDDIARSLQAKLRKDLISNFNKTSLGKKIISESAATHRLTLSPLILALNTLVAEFLYALNCHFTLSVFCTEVPYRNTLPNFTVEGHFRFSEREIFEIFDALCSNFQMQTKDVMCKEYSKERNHSLLFVLLRNLLSKQSVLGEQPPVQLLEHEQSPKIEKPKKHDSKAECQSSNFRYLNKYLMVLSKKIKEMSQNFELLAKTRNSPQIQRKSIQTRKFEKLNRGLEKISDNLRQMSVSRKRNKKLTDVVTAVNTMAIQFERCATNFEHISMGFKTASIEKSYSDWIKEMRTTDNGKRFLEKVESSLKKTLHRENEKKERELEQRLQIQKNILKTKYKQKLAEELIKHTSRGKEDKTNESFEQKLHEFEAKHKELHQRIHEAEERIRESPVAREESRTNQCVMHIDSKETQTVIDTIQKPTKITQDQLQHMVKSVSEQERQIDHIVFDAKFRIQQLEQESNQLDRSFRDYLERQRSEKQKMRESATFIWQSYALGKSMLDKKCATYRLPPRTIEKHAIVCEGTVATPTIPIINIDTVSAENAPAFENPYRTAQRKVLARSKTLPPPPLTPTDTDSSAQKYTQSQLKGQKQPSVYQLIEHSYKDNESHKTVEENLQPHCIPTSVASVAQLSPELNLQDITLDGIEISARSSSLRSGESIGSSSSPRAVFKLKRQLFTTTDNSGSCPSSSNGQQMNSTKKAEEPLKQINKENGDDGKKSIDEDRKNVSLDRSTTAMGHGRKGEENRTSEGHSAGSSGDKLDAPLPLTGKGEDVSS